MRDAEAPMRDAEAAMRDAEAAMRDAGGPMRDAGARHRHAWILIHPHLHRSTTSRFIGARIFNSSLRSRNPTPCRRMEERRAFDEPIELGLGDPKAGMHIVHRIPGVLTAPHR